MRRKNDEAKSRSTCLTTCYGHGTNTYMAIAIKALQVVAILVTLGMPCTASPTFWRKPDIQQQNEPPAWGVRRINKNGVLFINLTLTTYCSHPTKIICICNECGVRLHNLHAVISLNDLLSSLSHNLKSSLWDAILIETVSES